MPTQETIIRKLQSGASATGNGSPASVNNYSICAFNVIISNTATVTFEGSADGGTTWVSLNCLNLTTGALGSTATTSGVYRTQISGLDIIRARISSYTSGTIDVTARVSHALATTDLPGDGSGNIKVTLGTKISGEDQTNDVLKVENRYSYTNITSATTTVVKASGGFLHAITVNTTAAGTITIYDNTTASGTKIGTIKASVGEQTFVYNVTAATGITIVTAAASDITVSWR